MSGETRAIYRVVCTGAHPYDVEAWRCAEGWSARRVGSLLISMDPDPRAAALRACVDEIEVVEVRAPGEYTTAERVDALGEALRALRASPPRASELADFDGDALAVWLAAIDRAIEAVST